MEHQLENTVCKDFVGLLLIDSCEDPMRQIVQSTVVQIQANRQNSPKPQKRFAF